MAKVLKIIARLIGGILEWLLIALIVFAFAIRTAPVQTYFAKLATDFLSKELGTTVRIDKLDIVFVDRVDLKGVLLMDEQADTLANIHSLLVNISGISAFSGKIHIDEATLDGGVVKINRHAKTGDYNYWFLEDYFASGSTSKKSKSPLLRIDKVGIGHIRFHYDDYRKSYSKRGMDFNHLMFTDVTFQAQQIQIKDQIISSKIDFFSTKEKCGFELSEFKCFAIVTPAGLSLKKLKIKTPQSEITSNDFKFLYSGFTDYREFVDSVAFDVKFRPSLISMKDISYFAPALTGMDQQLNFTGHITRFVKNLKVENFELTTGKKTKIKGTVILPDFNNIRRAFYQERLDYAYIDLKDIQSIKMPDDNSARYIKLDPMLNRLAFFEAKDVRVDGIYSEFVLSSDIVSTELGSVNIDNGILFTRNEANNSWMFEKSQAGEYDVKVNDFRLDKFLNDAMYGSVDGTFFLSGEAKSIWEISFNSIQGIVNRFDLDNYSYSNIEIEEGSLIDNVIITKANVKDKNLNLTYKGTIDLNGRPKLRMTIDLEKALLSKLGFLSTPYSNFVSKIELDVVGVDPNNMEGSMIFTGLNYTEGDKVIKIPSLNLNIERGVENDVFDITSTLLTGRVMGKIDFNQIAPNFLAQFAQIFPGLYKYEDKRVKNMTSNDHFSYSLITGDLAELLAVFAPDLYVKQGTSLIGDYNGLTKDFDLILSSKQIIYDGIVFNGVRVNQTFSNNQLEADYHLDQFVYNDSISLEDVSFDSQGNGDNLLSNLSWNPGGANETVIQWQTAIESTTKFNFFLEPSYFSLNEKRWDISNESIIKLDSTDLEIVDFKLTRGKQFIAINGHVSNNDNEKVKFELNEVDLQEISVLAGLSTELSGKLNGWGYISNPYTNLTYLGDLLIKDLYVDQEEIGDVYVMSQWDQTFNTVTLNGELLYKGIQSLDFSGKYFITRETDNLDFQLDFDQTNIAFANAFMDPQVMSDVRGFVDGSLKIRGTPARPIIEGEVDLKNASAKLAILGTSFSMNGVVQADEDGFYIDNMPISDVEGNTGSLIGSIYHRDYGDWNFDVNVNLEDDAVNKNPLQPWIPLPLNKFLVMNTEFKEGELYYGKAYGTGNVNIFGYSDNLEIEVNMKTEKGTWINFPFYGSSEIEEGSNFITFKSNDTISAQAERKIDFTGVDLNLNFEITPDADLKIIFNDQLGDEISAKGNGKFNIKLNQLGDISMDGTYRVAEGSKYNFALGPVKQVFYIVDGGTITWTGSPYDATIDLSTYYRVRASLAELSSEYASRSMQEVFCYLNLTESLMTPTIGFDIKVPKAEEAGKSLISRVTSDKDELNRQFFSLLLTKNFQPLRGSSVGGTSAALDLVSSQINSLLDQVSSGYKLNVDINSDQISGNELAFGVTKGFLDDRLTVTGSFGVENTNAGDQSRSALIGDLELEYKLNKDGTFRINVFNESNDNSVLQTQNQGRFRQGGGVYYREDFSDANDFKALQIFFDIFRKKQNKRYPIKRKKQQTPLPKDILEPKDPTIEK